MCVLAVCVMISSMVRQMLWRAHVVPWTADDAEPPDLYGAHRRDANRLSRRWQRGMHRAAAAFAAGDPGAAHRLAAEARRIRSGSQTCETYCKTLQRVYVTTCRPYTWGWCWLKRWQMVQFEGRSFASRRRSRLGSRYGWTNGVTAKPSLND